MIARKHPERFHEFLIVYEELDEKKFSRVHYFHSASLVTTLGLMRAAEHQMLADAARL